MEKFYLAFHPRRPFNNPKITRMIILLFSPTLLHHLMISFILELTELLQVALLESGEGELTGEGFKGFQDIVFMGRMLLSLILATVLSATIAYHPTSKRSIDTIEEIERPKIFMMYAIVGSVIGTLVLKYGIVVGFVIFGIGGLARFRSDLGSATKTGRVIFVTVIGLCCGLDLPHVAVVATLFTFIMVFFMDAKVTYNISVKGVQAEQINLAATVYASALRSKGCELLSERHDFNKREIKFLFRTPRKVGRSELEESFADQVPMEFQGSVDWTLN